jgi:prepilin-type N-terminal cleavage/methylation domain-containing protein
MFSKSKGFTLTELLFVIIVINILAGGMMLATGSAVTLSRASVLISDLRNVNAAAVSFFADNVGSTDASLKAAWNNDTMRLLFRKYMDNPEAATELTFRLSTPASGKTEYHIGKSEDKKVVNKAIGMTRYPYIILSTHIGQNSIILIRVK